MSYNVYSKTTLFYTDLNMLEIEDYYTKLDIDFRNPELAKDY